MTGTLPSRRWTIFGFILVLCFVTIAYFVAFDNGDLGDSWKTTLHHTFRKTLQRIGNATERFKNHFLSNQTVDHVNRTSENVPTGASSENQVLSALTESQATSASSEDQASSPSRENQASTESSENQASSPSSENQAASVSSENQDTNQKCSPAQHVLFLKTHKAGSSTVSNIFFRYGDAHSLSFVLGSDTLIGWPTRFRLGQAMAFDGTRPNFLASHTRFNKKTMHHLFPKDASKYVTIVRNPVKQFESVFNYMGIGKIYGFGNDPNESLKAFLKKGIEYKDITRTGASRLARNPQSFDLGLDYKFYQDAQAVKDYIEFLDKEFDLVMVSDYFDESAVLLKRLLCWEFEDVLYMKSNERLDKEKAAGFSDDVIENIKRWNKADMLLFDHFNQTFWRKIEMEGESFKEDLATYRRMKAELKSQCFTDEMVTQRMYGSKMAKGFKLRSDLSPDVKAKCERMTRTENNYLAYLRNKRTERLKGIFRAEPNEDDQEKVSWDVASDFKYEPV
ncbi:galactosylceramide sulfotransferase-like isoform X4 [Oculina patagonica]